MYYQHIKSLVSFLGIEKNTVPIFAFMMSKSFCTFVCNPLHIKANPCHSSPPSGAVRDW